LRGTYCVNSNVEENKAYTTISKVVLTWEIKKRRLLFPWGILW